MQLNLGTHQKESDDFIITFLDVSLAIKKQYRSKAKLNYSSTLSHPSKEVITI